MKFIVRSLAVIGVLAILVVAIGSGFLLLSWMSRPGVPSKTILELNLETSLAEYVNDDPIARALASRTPIVRDIVEALERGGDDARVVGLVARVGAASIGMAQVQEIRDAILNFRSKNKFAIAFSETFGEVGPGTTSYYLATAFDTIYLQPSGDIGLTGIIMETPFLSGTLEKLGITPHMDQRYEYKNAMNTFTHKKMTPPHREAMEKLVTSWFSQMIRAISESRHLSEDGVRALVDRGPLLGKEAVDARLVDGLAYRDEAYAEAKKKAGDNAELLYLNKYLERAGRPHDSGKTIALIYGVGAVVRGKSGYDPVFGDLSMGAETVSAAFRAAIEDDSVKAILFRVDSPGGSYVASDAIWRETLRAKQAGKPVIVSMGDLAASGGYFVSMSADKIVAQPGTITASIGVLGGKMVTAGFWDKVGFSWDEVHAGANATMWSTSKAYTPAEWARFQAWLDRVYADFTGKVAEGRKLQKERVLEIAKGRIWTGEDAKGLGLVDELGGFSVALKLAKQAAGIGESEKVRLRVFPSKKSALSALFDEGYKSSEQEGMATALTRALEVIQPIARRVRMIDSGGNRGVLSIPEAQYK